ncbi:hypothetical protein BS78_02G366300 [Paspalum vaginatum]|nr:hypothetical protein BS78_02G366300 [Paspalum vaginatum]
MSRGSRGTSARHRRVRGRPTVSMSPSAVMPKGVMRPWPSCVVSMSATAYRARRRRRYPPSPLLPRLPHSSSTRTANPSPPTAATGRRNSTSITSPRGDSTRKLFEATDFHVWMGRRTPPWSRTWSPRRERRAGAWRREGAACAHRWRGPTGASRHGHPRPRMHHAWSQGAGVGGARRVGRGWRAPRGGTPRSSMCHRWPSSASASRSRSGEGAAGSGAPARRTTGWRRGSRGGSRPRKKRRQAQRLTWHRCGQQGASEDFSEKKTRPTLLHQITCMQWSHLK